jgi:hypothetical protein
MKDRGIMKMKSCLCLVGDYIGYRVGIEYKFVLLNNVYYIYHEGSDEHNSPAYRDFSKSEFEKCFVDLSKQKNRDSRLNKILK